jgi:hypothetical protein
MRGPALAHWAAPCHEPFTKGVVEMSVVEMSVVEMSIDASVARATSWRRPGGLHWHLPCSNHGHVKASSGSTEITPGAASSDALEPTSR